MKKIDKLIISSFLGPFFLTLVVVVFILLTQHMIKYFDDIVGKGLGAFTIMELLLYFAIVMTPVAMPLAVLLSSLMTFGNLGEHFELTAIKSAGISLTRTLVPMFVFVLFLTVFAFFSNNYFVPNAALEAYSLLYDIKQKKPAMELKEGAFYNGIPDFSIRVEKKYEDGKSLKSVMIYDHRQKNGNKEVYIADSGRMYMIHNDLYLMLELYNGHGYTEGTSNATGVTGQKSKGKKESLSRSEFDKSQFVMDLSSFALGNTDKNLFRSNRIMRNLGELSGDMDSVQWQMKEKMLELHDQEAKFFLYHLKDRQLALSEEMQQFKEEKADTARMQPGEPDEEDLAREKPKAQPKVATRTVANRQDTKVGLQKQDDKRPPPKGGKGPALKKAKQTIDKSSKKAKKPSQKVTIADQKLKPNLITGSEESIERYKAKGQKKSNEEHFQEIYAKPIEMQALDQAINQIRQVKSKISSHYKRVKQLEHENRVFEIQWHKILSNSVACIIMFLIGAPLGAIIKRGGLGVPVLISIGFFIFFYVLTMLGEKWAKKDLIEPFMGIWSANTLLLPIGLFFLSQARRDARLFDVDFYRVVWQKLLERFAKKPQALG